MHLYFVGAAYAALVLSPILLFALIAREMGGDRDF